MKDNEHLQEIGKRAEELQNNLEQMVKKAQADVEELIRLIRPPNPITSVVDFGFIKGILDSLNAQLKTFGDSRDDSYYGSS